MSRLQATDMANTSSDSRPDPDALLAQVQADERKATRGKLRIYFGASAGVGKTYAMLSAGRKLKAEGRDVLIGLVETHGRAETEALLEGMTILPRKTIAYRDRTLTEFDIDAALEKKPGLLLVDELAHSNAPGSRHPKRWQDVDELLSSGIDVFTTLNVQHLESLNDVVGGITGIRVGETLPDTMFDHADEVVLVDIPADELLARLKAGKVYQINQAERASRNFFRKGNLIALREIALRRTADRLEDDVQAYRVEQSIGGVWKTGAALLVSIGPRAGNEHVVRSAARLASQLNAEWHAVYVETPALQRLASGDRERILRTLKLAETLGAKTVVLSGDDIARAIVDYAGGHNFSKIVMGRPHPSWPWQRPHIRRVAELMPEVDLVEVGPGKHEEKGPEVEASTAVESTLSTAPTALPLEWPRDWRYLWAVAASLATAAIATPLIPYLDLANIVMLFLLTVVLVAVRFGRGPAVVATFVAVAAFDYFFVPPRFTFAVTDVQYLVVFAVMLAVGLITSYLTASLRFQARIAASREARARALYEFARELSAALETMQLFEITVRTIEQTFRVKAVLLLPDDANRLQWPPPRDGQPTLSVQDLGIAQWAFDHARPAGMSTDTLPGSGFFHLPLVAPMRTRGVLSIQPESRRLVLIPEQRQQLDTFATLAAIALERVHYIEVAQRALVRMESEKLRNSLLAAISHDLRTPLTSLAGLSESLALSKPPLGGQQQELAEALHAEALRMNALVSNLLDMAKIQSGEVKLKLEWQPFEEVVGSALRDRRALLGGRTVQTKLEHDLPLVRFDAVLIERVLANLLENEAKYTPPTSIVVIAAAAAGSYLRVSVYDDGPGLPPGKEETIFEKFTRGDSESATPGIGLGLAICRAIVEAHGGTIGPDVSPLGGACIAFTLPLGSPPSSAGIDGEPAAGATVQHAA
jgi:two-component system sensor histidine kinase KdpD